MFTKRMQRLETHYSHSYRDENSLPHKQSVLTYLTRSKITSRVDTDLLSQYTTKKVLKRILADVKFSASQFSGTFGSLNNGNYLLSEFDLVFEDLKNLVIWKIQISNLSENICVNFIILMGKKVQ